MVRQPDNLGFRASQPLSCKACSRRHIGHTSSEHNAVRTAAVALPSGEPESAHGVVAVSRRMPNMPSKLRLAMNRLRFAES